MIFDLRELKRSGKTSQTFYAEIEPEPQLCDIPGVEVAGNVRVTGKVTLTGEHSAAVEGEAAYLLSGSCTRCLEQTEKVCTAEFFEECGGADSVYPAVNDKIDITKIVLDVVMTNMPVNFLCGEDCKGLCPVCGGNLNKGECKCK